MVTPIDLDDTATLQLCFPVFQHLRPHLSQEEFLARVRKQKHEGYRIAAILDAKEAVAAIGFRISHHLAWGKVLYIDDLVTHPSHSRKGHGSGLLDWVSTLARNEHCDQIHLDTGYGRHDAHRLYLNKGFQLTCHHMSSENGFS